MISKQGMESLIVNEETRTVKASLDGNDIH